MFRFDHTDVPQILEQTLITLYNANVSSLLSNCKKHVKQLPSLSSKNYQIFPFGNNCGPT